MAEDDILKDTLEVKVNGHSYEFKIPSFADEIKVGMVAKSIRRELDDTGGTGSPEGLDYGTFLMIQTAAQMQILLRKADVEWPWSPGPNGQPVVDYRKWPLDKVDEASNIGFAFQSELSRFRNGGVQPESIGEETVGSSDNSGTSEPVARRTLSTE